MSYFVFYCYLYVSCSDQLPRLGKRELICLISFTCNYVVSVRRGFLFLLVLGMGCVILLWHSLCLPYNYSLSLPKRSLQYFSLAHFAIFIGSLIGFY